MRALSFIYRAFIKYCVFSLKFCDFSELCQFCCSACFLPAWYVYTHWHRGKTEFGIFKKKIGKNTIYTTLTPSLLLPSVTHLVLSASMGLFDCSLSVRSRDSQAEDSDEAKNQLNSLLYLKKVNCFGFYRSCEILCCRLCQLDFMMTVPFSCLAVVYKMYLRTNFFFPCGSISITNLFIPTLTYIRDKTVCRCRCEN